MNGNQSPIPIINIPQTRSDAPPPPSPHDTPYPPPFHHGPPTSVVHAHALEQVVGHRLHRLQAQAVHVGVSVVARQGGQVDARHSLQQPGSLAAGSQSEQPHFTVESWSECLRSRPTLSTFLRCACDHQGPVAPTGRN